MLTFQSINAINNQGNSPLPQTVGPVDGQHHSSEVVVVGSQISGEGCRHCTTTRYRHSAALMRIINLLASLSLSFQDLETRNHIVHGYRTQCQNSIQWVNLAKSTYFSELSSRFQLLFHHLGFLLLLVFVNGGFLKSFGQVCQSYFMWLLTKANKIVQRKFIIITTALYPCTMEGIYQVLTRVFMKCFLIQWTIIILDKTCFWNLYVIWLSKKALKTVWPFDILFILLGISNFSLSKSTAIFTFRLFSRVAILCSASSTAVVVSSTFWCSGLTLEIIILWYLTTPMTHLHRAPQAELLVFLSKASGSKLGFFRYGSTKSSVDSGSWLSSNDINSSMNLKSINFYHLFKFATCNIF